MIQINEAIIRNTIFHHVDLENTFLIPNEIVFDYSNEEEESILKRTFLNPFQSSYTTNEFAHDFNLELNTLFQLSNAIYSGEDFVETSKNIYQHLINVSKHPNIKNGDLFIIKYDNIILDNKFFEGLGIYKIENKESFIETKKYGNKESGLTFKKGIGSKKLDKACLILFTEKPFTIFVIDDAKTGTDYWQNEFIKLKPKKDNVNDTNQFLNLTKTFITKQLPYDFQATKADQIDLLNRSVGYFKSHDIFDKQEFEKEVFFHDNIISSFNDFDKSFRKQNEVDIADDFEISKQVVKKQERTFKSVLRLDKNFDIHIHGDKNFIEKGVEKDGRKYYKIYYEQET